MKIISAIVLITLMVGKAYSQFHVNAPMIISSNTQVAISGNLVTTDSLINQGQVFLAGNWQNNGAFVSNTGEVMLNGTAMQTVNSSHLIINHLAIMGGGDKLFNNNLTITGELELMDGYLVPADTNVHIVMGPDSQIFGGSSDSFVDGMLYLSGTGNLFYPIGKNNLFLPVEIFNLQGTSAILGYEAHEPNPNPIAGIGLSSVSDRRYWRRNILAGNVNPYQITLSVLNDEGFNEVNDIVVAEAESLQNGFRSLGQYHYRGDVMSGMVTSFDLVGNDFLALGITTDAADQKDIFIPSGLSPYAADPDDAVIKIYSSDLRPDDFLFRIYNKRGELVYESLSLQAMMTSGWNGLNIANGRLVEPGIYNYTMTCKSNSGEVIDKTGTITMVR